jgi:hypothetical protein
LPGIFKKPSRNARRKGGPQSGVIDFSDEVGSAERSDSPHSMGLDCFFQRNAGDFRLSALLPALRAGTPAGGLFLVSMVFVFWLFMPPVS